MTTGSSFPSVVPGWELSPIQGIRFSSDSHTRYRAPIPGVTRIMCRYRVWMRKALQCRISVFRRARIAGYCMSVGSIGLRYPISHFVSFQYRDGETLRYWVAIISTGLRYIPSIVFPSVALGWRIKHMCYYCTWIGKPRRYRVPVFRRTPRHRASFFRR